MEQKSMSVCLTQAKLSLHIYLYPAHIIYTLVSITHSDGAAEDAASHLPLAQTMPGDIRGFL